MTILILGDLHLSDKSPSACTESYNEDLFDLMNQTVELAKNNNYSAVIQAGDFYHHKSPNRTSHKTVQRSIELINSYPCPFYIVPGNHDLVMDRLESVMDTQPLGVLLRSGANLLQGWGPGSVYGVPWIAEWADKSDDGQPSPRALTAVQNALLEWNASTHNGPRLLVTHSPLYPPGYELEFENFPTKVFAEMMGNRGSAYYGHIHEPHGEYVVGSVNFCNQGALSRGSLHEYNLVRDVCVTEWDEETGDFTRIVLDYKPASEVFRLSEVVENKQSKIDINEFLTSIGQSTIEIVNIESVLNHIRSLKLGPEVESVVVRLLEEA